MEKYDVIIIGSGLGGLECGVILGREGYKVLILEKNKQVGGNLQIFSRDKRIFDTGVHYVGGLEPGQNLHAYFTYFGIMDDLKLHQMSREAYDIVSFEGDPIEYPYGQGYDQYIEGLANIFPEEREGIQKFCDKVREVCQAFPLYQLEVDDNPIGYKDVLNLKAAEFIDSCTENEKLRKVLGGTNPLFAGIGSKTPFYILALVTNSYIESAWKFVDGGGQIAKLLVKELRKVGGQIKKHADVVKIEFEDKRAKSVLTKSGERYFGDIVISNVHPAYTVKMIEPGILKRAFTKRVSQMENTSSVFILYLSLKEGSTPFIDSNYYHYINDDVWGGVDYDEEAWPPSYAVFSGVSSKTKEYCDTMIVMAYMKMEEVEEWDSTFNTVSEGDQRGESYEDFKKAKAEKLLDAMEDKFPGIRDRIENYYTSTPLTYRDYINTPGGSMYGIMKDASDPLRSFVSPRTKVPNLLFTGQNLNMHGVLGVTIGAVQTCSEIVGHKYLMEKILSASNVEA